MTLRLFQRPLNNSLRATTSNTCKFHVCRLRKAFNSELQNLYNPLNLLRNTVDSASGTAVFCEMSVASATSAGSVSVQKLLPQTAPVDRNSSTTQFICNIIIITHSTPIKRSYNTFTGSWFSGIILP